jgi:geranylgeranyl pyrophosphate synthase
MSRSSATCSAASSRAAGELGGLVSGGPPLGPFGHAIGLAFQILDDVLDITGPAERTGKRRGTDLLDGTVTLPLILARERSPELATLDLRTIADAAEAERVCEAIEATGAAESARGMALDLVATAKRDLPAELPARQRQVLELIADSLVDRYA